MPTLADFSAALLLVTMTASIFLWPWVLYAKMAELSADIDQLKLVILSLEISPDGDGDDPGDGEEPEQEPSNVIAIGRKVA